MSLNFVGPVVLDSSVIIKWFRRYEVFQEQAFLLRSAYLDGDLSIYVPDLLIYEVANVLRYKSDIDYATVQQALQSLFDIDIGIESISPQTIRRTVLIAHSYDITVYDAAYVALSQQLGANFITADRKLIQKLHDANYVHYLADLVWN